MSHLLAEIRDAEQSVKNGHYVCDEDMRAWLLSWGSSRELPLPKAVCGKRHDEDAS